MAFRFGPKRYDYVQIGTQKWMTRNLDVNRYRNGDPIPQVTDSATWNNLTTGAWCYLNNNITNGVIYGKLYNWYAVNDARGLAPQGWHIPSDTEWTTITNYLGGLFPAGIAMINPSTWPVNTDATNSSGFTALPGGWWSSTEYATYYAWMRAPSSSGNNVYINRGNYSKYEKFSIRCIKD